QQVIDIAVESALSAHRGATPRMTRVVNSDLKMRSGPLVLIADIMRVAIGNACVHSNMSTPGIRVVVDEPPNANILRFCVTSEALRGSRNPESEARLDAVRAQIEDGTYIEKVRTEGGSGLMKLAALVHQSEHGKLEFGFLSDTEFRVEIELSLGAGQ